jgi:hypothetical protein
LSESKLYHIHRVFQIIVEGMLYYRWGCFLYQSWVVVIVEQSCRVNVIARVEVIPYTFGFPISESKLYQNFPCSESVVGSIS